MKKIFSKAKGVLFGLSGTILIALPGCSMVGKIKAKQHPVVFGFSVIVFFVILAALGYIGYKQYKDKMDGEV